MDEIPVEQLQVSVIILALDNLLSEVKELLESGELSEELTQYYQSIYYLAYNTCEEYKKKMDNKPTTISRPQW